MSSVDSITYNCAKYLADILSPLVGKTDHFVKNSQQFAETIQELHVEQDEVLHSYDVSALFTSVPVDGALKVIESRLHSDHTLPSRTALTPSGIVQLLDVCLKCTYFVYNEQFYLQIHGCPMGSPVSPLICNLYMEDFESKAIATSENPPGWWYRYVDDTHIKQKREHLDKFTEHINSIDPCIKFTSEPENDGSLPFLDTSTTRKEDGSLKVTIYRKPTHTDQYLNFASNHPLDHKLGVVRTLYHRADTVVTEEADAVAEKKHIDNALSNCGYPNWVLNSVKNKKARKRSKDNRSHSTSASKGFVTIPFIKGLTEPLKRIYSQYGIKACVKPSNTLRQLLCSPKDKTKKEYISGPVYHISCEGSVTSGCPDSYIGETERTLRARFQEHCRPSSVNSEISRHIHKDSPGHNVDINNAKILEREPRWFERGVKEAIHIRAKVPSLNKDGGRHQLPHIWDRLISKQLGSSATPPGQ